MDKFNNSILKGSGLQVWFKKVVSLNHVTSETNFIHRPGWRPDLLLAKLYPNTSTTH